MIRIYKAKFRLKFCKEVCWVNISLRECRLASQLAQSVEKFRIGYFEKSRLMDLSGLSVEMVWQILSNAVWVNSSQLFMMKICLRNVAYYPKSRPMLCNEVKFWRVSARAEAEALVICLFLSRGEEYQNIYLRGDAKTELF